MKEFLKKYLSDKIGKEEYYHFSYQESIVTPEKSYIYKVAILAAIDSNKCDFVHVAIGSQRSENSTPEIKGHFYFSEGENDDMGRVLDRVVNLLKMAHPAFEP